ncbi:Ig-like domain-containing protein, partial [Stenotrophomonas indicatrix]|uniref:Ig-like domain-containing protein n=1 Tax=Stenotrophomonas indicatrix TaxID=2045451 RepID=UPI002655A692
MAIRVKVVPVSETITATTPATTVANNVVVLQQSSDVALDIDPDQVAGYVKDGQDLVVQLKNGDNVRIANFYVDGQAPSQLFLVDKEKLVAVDLPAAASDGPLAASYLPQDTLAGFDSMTAAGAATTAGGVSGAMILGGLAAVGAAVALASSGGDGGGGGETSPPPPAPPPPDATAPSAPTALAVSADGRTLTGRGEAGTTVRVDSNGDGRPDTTGTVGADGRFSITLSPPLTNGEQITVTLADAAGNVSGPGQVTAPDTTPPAAATNVVVSDDGSSVSGNGEPGATVGVDTNGDGQPDITGVVGGDGQFTLPLDPPLTNGETVSVVVTDPAGNSSPPVSVQAPDYPDAPLLDASNGSVISGTAGAGLTIVLTDGDGNPIGQAVADANGDWSFTPSTALADGTVVNAVAQDSAGNSSPVASITVDAVAPAAPVVDPSNGSELSGTAEAGSTVTLTDGSGNPIGEAIADADGNWSFTPGTPLADGTVVNATATDAAGNTSGPGSATVDAVAPALPTVNLSNGSSLNGTAEPGSTVTLTDGSGNPIGQVTADGSGNWSFTPSTPLADGTVVNVVAEDAAGNTSPPATVTVDASAPAAPVLNASNGTTISGTAEAGSTVTLTDGSGNPIGQVTADGSGNWSFTPGTPLANGTVVVATATDPTGNTGPQAATTVDALAPAAPVVDPSNGVTISGTAEAGATVTLTDGGGNPIGQVTADGSGNWSFTPGTPLADGTVVNATATDAAGNTSGPGSATVDAVAPALPTVNLS